MDSFSRRRFLETSAAALGVSLLGCSSDPNTPPNSSPSAGGAAGVKAVAGADGALKLTSVAGIEKGKALAFTLPDGEPGLYFVTQSGESGAVSARCTHAGCVVEWQGEAAVPLRCPCHESHFALDGKVLSGPAQKPLARYNATVSGDEATLRAA
ncbi:MAG TPA: ubiquinol-cytochrome c reductase iron-sulfur subunit [Abditibacterium sp.]|jgi:cytochrome b6-f complex iron-sulfur subunit